MGQIYRWTDLVKGSFASRENLSVARTDAVFLLRKLHDRGWIECGSIFGSVARGDYSIGSDFDVLVIANPEKQKAVEKYLQRIFSISMTRLGVEPGIILINSKEARSGNHSVSKFLFDHIKSTSNKETTVGTDPTKVIRIKKTNPIEFMRPQFLFHINTARKQIVRMRFHRTQDTDAYYNELGHAIDRTINSARHVLDFSGALPTPGGKIDDRKSTVVATYCRAFPGNRTAVQALQKVANASSRYRKSLAKAVIALKSGNRATIAKAKGEYEAALKGIEAVVPDNITFLSENVKILDSLKRKKTRKKFPAKRITPRRTRRR